MQTDDANFIIDQEFLLYFYQGCHFYLIGLASI
jgi:hypothetical protein